MNKINTDTRKISKQGIAFMVTLPIGWVDENNITEAIETTILYNNVVLILRPNASIEERRIYEDMLSQSEVRLDKIREIESKGV